MFILRTPAAIKSFHQIPKNCHFGVKKIIPTQVDFYNTHMVPYTIPKGNYNFPRSTNKISFFNKISTSGKNCQFNQRPFPSGEGSNLILGTGTENQNIYSKNSSCYEVFHQILKNCNFGVKNIHYPPRWICMTHVWSHTLFLGLL